VHVVAAAGLTASSLMKVQVIWCMQQTCCLVWAFHKALTLLLLLLLQG
jgi:hypothetical protein